MQIEVAMPLGNITYAGLSIDPSADESTVLGIQAVALTSTLFQYLSPYPVVFRIYKYGTTWEYSHMPYLITFFYAWAQSYYGKSPAFGSCLASTLGPDSVLDGARTACPERLHAIHQLFRCCRLRHIHDHVRFPLSERWQNGTCWLHTCSSAAPPSSATDCPPRFRFVRYCPKGRKAYLRSLVVVGSFFVSPHPFPACHLLSTYPILRILPPSPFPEPDACAVFARTDVAGVLRSCLPHGRG